jgi:hypothetical protein
MARQLPDGKWTSKIGGEEDITHFLLDAVEAYGPRYGPNRKAEYGCAVVYFRRLILVSHIVRFVQSLQLRVESILGRL